MTYPHLQPIRAPDDSSPGQMRSDALPIWNLDDLYLGRDDPRINQDLEAAALANQALVELKGAFIAGRANPERLALLIQSGMRHYEDATDKLWAVGAYAGLAASTARDDPDWARFEADIRSRSLAISAESLFYTLELNQLEAWEIEAALRADPALERWRPWLRRVRLSRPFELGPDLERLFVDRAPGVANWTRLFDETLTRLRAQIGQDSLPLPEALNRLSDPDPEQRRLAADGLAHALEANGSGMPFPLRPGTWPMMLIQPRLPRWRRRWWRPIRVWPIAIMRSRPRSWAKRRSITGTAMRRSIRASPGAMIGNRPRPWCLRRLAIFRRP
jgi:hypothetical protein